MNVRRTLLLVGAAVLVSACGVRSDRHVTVADAADVPFGLLNDSPGPTSEAVGPASTSLKLCFYAGGRLTEVERAGDPGLGAVLASLADTRAVEAAVPLSTAVVDETIFDRVSVRAGVAIVDLGTTFTAADVTAQLRAIAQVVCTLTARPGIGQVAFTLDGAPIAVPRGDGSTTAEAVARDDYSGLFGDL